MKKVILFISGKCLAVLSIVFGVICVVAHHYQELPFGITTNDVGIGFMWAYVGTALGALLIVAGLYYLFKRKVDRMINQMAKKMGK